MSAVSSLTSPLVPNAHEIASNSDVNISSTLQRTQNLHACLPTHSMHHPIPLDWKNRTISVCTTTILIRKKDLSVTRTMDWLAYSPAPVFYIIGFFMFGLANRTKSNEYAKHIHPEDASLKEANFMATIGIVFFTVAIVFTFPAIYRACTSTTSFLRHQIECAENLLEDLQENADFTWSFFNYIVQKEGTIEKARQISFDGLVTRYVGYKLMRPDSIRAIL
jgi:hypothetical protein